jgi:hypothetical protein
MKPITTIIVLLFCFALHLPSMAQKDTLNLRKLALIIGNKDYQHATVLKNTINDAQDMANTLKSVGFETLLYKNLDYTSFIKAIHSFSEKAPDYDILLFYFSGHGMMYLGENYLVPVDAVLKNNEQQVEVECINIKRITTNFNIGEGKANIAIIDACRNKPFNRSWNSDTRDLEAGSRFMVKGVSGSIIAQSADEGETSSDNPKGNNGLYTACLIRYMKEPGLTINEVFQLARREVMEKSKNAQNPIEFNQLVGNFYFIPPSVGKPSSAVKIKTDLASDRKKEKTKSELPVSNSNETQQVPARVPPKDPNLKSVRLQEGTTVRIILKEELSSKKAAVGDPVEMEIQEDVLVEGHTVIKAGTMVKGEVTQITKAKMLGQQGKIDFFVNYTSSIDFQNIRLRSSRKYEGKNNTAGMAVAAAFALPAIFIKGKEAVIPKGTQFSAYVDNTYTVSLSN